MELNRFIEHTLLKSNIKEEDLVKLLDEAKENNFLGVCINPENVGFAKKYLEGTGVKIVTVIGFPLGANRSDVKAFETKKAVEDGADEIDMVINLKALKDKNYEKVKEDIEAVVESAQDKPVKVIFETDLLEKDEIAKACEICIEAGASFVKTSTGFVKDGVGAKAEDIKIMADIVKPHGLQVKASGGVRDLKGALAMIEAGATRLGTSSGVQIINGQKHESGY